MLKHSGLAVVSLTLSLLAAACTSEANPSGTGAPDAADHATTDSPPQANGTVADGGHDDSWLRQDASAADAAVDPPHADAAIADAAVADAAKPDPAKPDAAPEASPGAGIPTPLIAYYKFDEATGTEIYDSSGNNNHGTHNAVYIAGKKGGALSFDGTTGAKVVGNDAFTWGDQNADYSVLYWIWITKKADANWVSPFHKTDATGANCCSGTQRSPAQYFTPGALTLISIMGTVNDANHYTGATTAFPTGEWVHFAAVHAGANQRVYVNGQLAFTDALGGATVGGTGVLYLGNDTYYVGLVGAMDEVKVYGTALTQAQVQADMQ
jgi:hypothetical protein